MVRRSLLVAAVLGGAGLAALPAAGGQARCYNSDDGTYACSFEQFGGDGSFIVAAPARPTYTVQIVGRGVAEVFGDFGSGNRFLPGPFYRSAEDRACWVSEATQFALCAY